MARYAAVPVYSAPHTPLWGQDAAALKRPVHVKSLFPGPEEEKNRFRFWKSVLFLKILLSGYTEERIENQIGSEIKMRIEKAGNSIK
jgi:hypothetical protein